MTEQSRWMRNREEFESGEATGYVGRVTELARNAMDRVRDLNISESTIPDAFSGAPKFISPRGHRWLDVAVTGYFLGLGAWFVSRRKGGPAASAFVNAAMVGGVSLMTDYEGTGEKPISFKLHGTLDAVQAASAALGPVLHGFAGERDAFFFYGQALNEIGVIASTDWDAGMAGREERLAA